MRDERPVRRRPRHTVGGGDLGDGAGGLADRRPDLGAQPAGGAGPGRDLLDRLGERSTSAVVLRASPPCFIPPQQYSIFPVGDVLRPGGHTLLDGGREDAARRARRRCVLVGHQLHQPGAVRVPGHADHPYSWQPKQHCRTLDHALGPSVA